ncbi:MAG: LysR family transcriptional regulator [Peptococcaceae bacterium]
MIINQKILYYFPVCVLFFLLKVRYNNRIDTAFQFNRKQNMHQGGIRMKIEQLQYLLTLADSTTITAASRHLYITPQALSVAIKRMENDLGISIISTHDKKIEFTPDGQLLLASARIICNEYEHLQNELFLRTCSDNSASDCTLSGQLSLYSNFLWRKNILPAVIKKFRIRYPQVQINFFEKDVNAIYDYFANTNNQQYTIGFVQVPELEYQKPVSQWLTSSQYQFVSVCKGNYYACLAKDSPLFPNVRKVSITQILEYPLIIYFNSDNTQHLYDTSNFQVPLITMLKQYGEINLNMVTSSLEAWSDFIDSHMGIGFVHDILLRLDPWYTENFRILEIDGDLSSTLGYLVSPNRSALCKKFEQSIREYFIRNKLNEPFSL